MFIYQTPWITKKSRKKKNHTTERRKKLTSPQPHRTKRKNKTIPQLELETLTFFCQHIIEGLGMYLSGTVPDCRWRPWVQIPEPKNTKSQKNLDRMNRESIWKEVEECNMPSINKI